MKLLTVAASRGWKNQYNGEAGIHALHCDKEHYSTSNRTLCFFLSISVLKPVIHSSYSIAVIQAFALCLWLTELMRWDSWNIKLLQTFLLHLHFSCCSHLHLYKIQRWLSFAFLHSFKTQFEIVLLGCIQKNRALSSMLLMPLWSYI